MTSKSYDVLTINSPMKRGVSFTDIHFGRKNSSDIHNQDCMNFVKFLREYVRSNSEIDHISFLGDWFEVRNSITGSTLNWSYESAKLINELGIPVLFIVGNHDLHNRNNRDLFNTKHFQEFKNFHIINEVTVVNGKAIYCPYLFDNEIGKVFDALNENPKAVTLFGHLEIKGFVLTGEYNVAKHGLEPDSLEAFNRIFTGHFHKRQNKKNVWYIGNCFPMDYSDANDIERGLMDYDFDSDTHTFVNWKECPKYVKVKLSDIMQDSKCLLKGSRAKVLVDIPLTYEEANALKGKLLEKKKLRELYFEDATEDTDILGDDNANLEEDELEDLSSAIEKMILSIDAKSIKPEKLVQIFKGLK